MGRSRQGELVEAGEESFILYSRGSYTFRIINDYLNRAGVRLAGFMEISNPEASKELIKVGMGVGLMADWVVDSEVRRGELKSLPLGRKNFSDLGRFGPEGQGDQQSRENLYQNGSGIGLPLDGEPSPLAYFPRVEQSQGLTCGFLLFSLQSMKYFWDSVASWPLLFAWSRGAVSEQAILAERTGFPMRFVLDKGRDLKETVSGNTLVATLPGVHPVFGEALTIRVRGLQAESIRRKIRKRPPWPLTKGLRSGDPWMSARVELRNPSVGKEGFGFGRTFT